MRSFGLIRRVPRQWVPGSSRTIALVTLAIALISVLLAAAAAFFARESAKASTKAAEASEKAAAAAVGLTEIERGRRAEELESRRVKERELTKARLKLQLIRNEATSLLVVSNDGPARARDVFVYPMAIHQDGIVPNVDEWNSPRSIPAGGAQSMIVHVDLSSTKVFGIEFEVRWEDDELHQERMSAFIQP